MFSRLMLYPARSGPVRRGADRRTILQVAALQSRIAILRPRGLAVCHRRVLRTTTAKAAGRRLALLQCHEIAAQTSAVTRLSLAPRIVARQTRSGARDKDPDGSHPDQAHVIIPFSVSAHTSSRSYRWRSADDATRRNAHRAAKARPAAQVSPREPGSTHVAALRVARA
jgi:hypothetical protein